MANYKVTDTELTSIADAIRLKGGTIASLAFPSGFVSAVQDLSIGFSAADEGKVVHSGALSIQDVMSVSQNSVYDTTLFSQVNVSIPDATLVSKIISENGTYYAASDSADGFSEVVVDVSGGGGGSVAIPSWLLTGGEGILSDNIVDGIVTSIRSFAFNGMPGLKEVHLSSVISVYTSAFTKCHSLSVVDMPNCKNIGSYAFASMGLKQLSMPECTTIYENAFTYCGSLSEVYLPKISIISSYVFAYCSQLKTVSVDSCERLSSYAFYSCINLQSITLPKVSLIMSSVFTQCSKLESVYILSSSVCMLNGGSYVFYNTPIFNSTYLGRYGSIFVPQSLVDAYKVADSWSRIADRITAYVEE